MTSSQAVSRRTPEAMQLLLDYQSKFPVDADPSCNGWPYNYDDECCPCPKPTPRPFHATFYLICHHTNHPIDDMKAFFQEVCHFMRRSVEVQIETDSDDEDRVAVTLVETRGGDHEVLARGSVDREGCTGPDRTGDPNIGFYAEFVASTQEGCQFLFHCRMSCTPGYSAFIPHEEMILDVDGGRRIVTRTGFVSDNNNGKEELATHFTLLGSDDTEMGRCHLLYRGGSDNSVGPTLQKFAIHRDRRGQGLAPLLWYWILDFISLGWTLECLDRNVEPGHAMIKAVQLTNAIVEIKDDMELVTDKGFFHNFAGFGVRVPTGGPPMDEEAVRYIKLATPEDVKATQSVKAAEVVVPWKNHAGPRTCDSCWTTAAKALRCTRCRRAFYCDRKCQRNDWKRHKLWCDKTQEEVREKLVEWGMLPYESVDDGTSAIDDQLDLTTDR